VGDVVLGGGAAHPEGGVPPVGARLIDEAHSERAQELELLTVARIAAVPVRVPGGVGLVGAGAGVAVAGVGVRAAPLVAVRAVGVGVVAVVGAAGVVRARVA
jgi:hypothetical protein